MKKLKFFTAALCIAASGANAQTTVTPSPDDTNMVVTPNRTKNDQNLYNSTGLQVQPEYPGGLMAFQSFISSNITLPKVADNTEELVLRTYVAFVVEKDGSVTDAHLLRDPGHGLGEQVLSAVKKSPKWSPGKENNTPVRVKYSLPVSVKIPPAGNLATAKQQGHIYLQKEVDNPPVYSSSGMAGFAAFINNGLEPSKLVGLKPDKYTVPMEFVVEPNGSISALEVRSKYTALNQEIARILTGAKSWVPGTVKGKKVRTKMSVKVQLTLSAL